MKLILCLFLSVLTILTACSEHNTPPVMNTTKQERLIAITEGDTVKELGNNIMLVYQDKKNRYWFGSWQDGLYRYDGKTVLHFTTKNGLPHNKVEEIKEDKSGNVYINTGSGISKFDGENFTTLTVSKLDSQWELAPNDVWFRDGWNSGFVFRYDGKYLYHLPLPKIQLGEDLISKHPDYPNPYNVYSIYKDRKENVWFGTATLGVFRFNGTSFDWILENDVTEIHDGPSNGVRSIMEDKDGCFWFNSMYRYRVYDTNNALNNADHRAFYSREKSVGSLDGKSGGDLNEYLSIAKDNNNDLWIATYNAGVWWYDGKKITHYRVQDGDKEITLFSIYKDNNGILWLGTHEWGTYKFNGQAFERFKPK